eukprot:352191-Chlamydomonas_euryale.AAC.3
MSDERTAFIAPCFVGDIFGTTLASAVITIKSAAALDHQQQVNLTAKGSRSSMLPQAARLSLPAPRTRQLTLTAKARPAAPACPLLAAPTSRPKPPPHALHPTLPRAG